MAAVEKKPFSRLPTKVVPKHYYLHVTPDLNALTFLGRLSVVVVVKEQTDVIKLNSVDIKVSACHFKGAGGTLEGKVEYDETAETMSAVFSQQLAVGEGSLELEYAGNLNGLMKGFYRSKYTTPSGEERYAAVTQFEPTDARRALPCWDEPALKATFDVTLCVPKDRTALSNMPEKSVKDLGEKREIVFERTPVMSTYLLAFIVGEYEFVEEKDKYGVLHRVYTPLGKKEHGRWALEVSVKSFSFYRKYFKIPCPLRKIDLIAITDFAADAMENWRLVTYRERLLLMDPQQSSLLTKRRVALLVAHELAHQWFGNLVTMEWWTHLRLNEGFATFMQYHFTYDIWKLFVFEVQLKTNFREKAMKEDLWIGLGDETKKMRDQRQLMRMEKEKVLKNIISLSGGKKGAQISSPSGPSLGTLGGTSKEKLRRLSMLKLLSEKKGKKLDMDSSSTSDSEEFESSSDSEDEDVADKWKRMKEEKYKKLRQMSDAVESLHGDSPKEYRDRRKRRQSIEISKKNRNARATVGQVEEITRRLKELEERSAKCIALTSRIKMGTCKEKLKAKIAMWKLLIEKKGKKLDMDSSSTSDSEVFESSSDSEDEDVADKWKLLSEKKGKKLDMDSSSTSDSEVFESSSDSEDEDVADKWKRMREEKYKKLRQSIDISRKNRNAVVTVGQVEEITQKLKELEERSARVLAQKYILLLLIEHLKQQQADDVSDE